MPWFLFCCFVLFRLKPSKESIERMASCWFLWEECQSYSLWMTYRNVTWGEGERHYVKSLYALDQSSVSMKDNMHICFTLWRNYLWVVCGETSDSYQPHNSGIFVIVQIMIISSTFWLGVDNQTQQESVTNFFRSLVIKCREILKLYY